MSDSNPKYQSISTTHKPLSNRLQSTQINSVDEDVHNSDEDVTAPDGALRSESSRTRVPQWLRLQRKPGKAFTAPSSQTQAAAAGHLKGWSWEFASFMVAITCLVGAVAMLASVEDKVAPAWTYRFSVSATLSVLVTVMRGAMGVVVAECLSQFKWTWFKRERKLGDFGLLDDASRGIWGAATLLKTRKPWLLPYIGSFVLLLSLIIGPTVQLAAETRVREIDHSQTALTPVCNTSYLDLVGSAPGPGQQRAALPAIGAIYNGLLQTDPTKSVVPSCSTGNCTFPTYQSLGICNQCTDLSSKMIYSLPAGFSDTLSDNESISFAECQKYPTACMVEVSGYGIQLVSQGLVNSTVDRNAEDDANTPSYTFEPPIGILRAILRQNGPSVSVQELLGYTAVECALRFCVNTYESSVRLGVYEERLVSSAWTGSKTSDDKPFSFSNDVTLTADPCYVDGVRVDAEDNENQCVYHVSGGNALALAQTFLPLLHGDAYLAAGGRVSWSSDIMTAIWGLFDSADLHNVESGTLNTVNKAMTSLARSLTAHARSVACGGAHMTGTVKRDEVYIHVVWPWLIPAIVELSLCLVFFVATIIHSRHDSLWKSSAQAYLFHEPLAYGQEVTPHDMIELVDDGAAKMARGDVAGMIQGCEEVEMTFVQGTCKGD